MTYLIMMDVNVDDDNIMEDWELEDAIKEMLNMVSIEHFRVFKLWKENYI